VYLLYTVLSCNVQTETQFLIDIRTGNRRLECVEKYTDSDTLLFIFVGAHRGKLNEEDPMLALYTLN
jgi:hypothetical protein